MVNINLSSGGMSPQQTGEKISWGWMIPLEIVLIVIILGGFAFLLYDISSLNKKIETAKSDYEAQALILKSESAKNVFDFQNRMNESDKLLSSSADMKVILQETEKSVIPEIYLFSFNFDAAKKEATAVCVGKSFEQVARQIASFKKSTYFSKVSAGESEITDKGEIKFPVTLGIK